MTDIQQLDQLISKKIRSKTITNLTSPGENYGSEMLKLHLVLEDETELNLVAKTLPLSEKMQEMFNCPITFPKEVEFYRTIIPTLRQFQEKHQIKNQFQFVADYYGSRFNLNGTETEIDSSAVLLLENLQIKGFANVDKVIGYGLSESKIILNDLAYFHGTAIALKIKEPDTFQIKIQSILSSLVPIKELEDDWREEYNKIIHHIPELQPFVTRLKKIDVADIYKPQWREPFATISHNDCWVNNTMVRFSNGKVIENKFVDFQLSSYSSVAKDVLFFLFSSVQNEILKEHCDDLLKYYYNTLLNVLEQFGIDLKPFSFSSFQNELKIEARLTQFAHTVLMCLIIFAPKSDVKEAEDLDPCNLGSTEFSKELCEKIIVIVEEFAKRNWI